MITCCREPDYEWIHHCGSSNSEDELLCEDGHSANSVKCHTVCKNCDSGTCGECNEDNCEEY